MNEIMKKSLNDKITGIQFTALEHSLQEPEVKGELVVHLSAGKVEPGKWENISYTCMQAEKDPKYARKLEQLLQDQHDFLKEGTYLYRVRDDFKDYILFQEILEKDKTGTYAITIPFSETKEFEELLKNVTSLPSTCPTRNIVLPAIGIGCLAFVGSLIGGSVWSSNIQFIEWSEYFSYILPSSIATLEAGGFYLLNKKYHKKLDNFNRENIKQTQNKTNFIEKINLTGGGSKNSYDYSVIKPLLELTPEFLNRDT